MDEVGVDGRMRRQGDPAKGRPLRTQKLVVKGVLRRYGLLYPFLLYAIDSALTGPCMTHRSIGSHGTGTMSAHLMGRQMKIISSRRHTNPRSSRLVERNSSGDKRDSSR
jgi:hypothetical protein